MLGERQPAAWFSADKGWGLAFHTHSPPRPELLRCPAELGNTRLLAISSCCLPSVRAEALVAEPSPEKPFRECVSGGGRGAEMLCLLQLRSSESLVTAFEFEMLWGKWGEHRFEKGLNARQRVFHRVRNPTGIPKEQETKQ